jgi:hypothetical protein
VARDLFEVAEGQREPFRAYIDRRFDGTRIRDEILQADRRGNLGALFGGFRRYSGADQARIDHLNEAVGKDLVEATCREAAEWAGYEQVRRLARLAANALIREQRPSQEAYEATGDEAFRAAVERARRTLAGIVRARGGDLPKYLFVEPEMDHGFSGVLEIPPIDGEGPSSFLGPLEPEPLRGSGVFGLPDA